MVWPWTAMACEGLAMASGACTFAGCHGQILCYLRWPWPGWLIKVWPWPARAYEGLTMASGASFAGCHGQLLCYLRWPWPMAYVGLAVGGQ